jgi:hypothetical protein
MRALAEEEGRPYQTVRDWIAGRAVAATSSTSSRGGPTFGPARISTRRRKTMATKPTPGIVERHARSCPSRHGGRCAKPRKPRIEAWVWSPRDKKKIYRTFTGKGAATAAGKCGALPAPRSTRASCEPRNRPRSGRRRRRGSRRPRGERSARAAADRTSRAVGAPTGATSNGTSSRSSARSACRSCDAVRFRSCSSMSSSRAASPARGSAAY